jgi:hypothetical protein
LGIYELEEGEILEHWDIDELNRIAKHIAIEQYKRIYQDIDDEPIEIVVHSSDSDDCDDK